MEPLPRNVGFIGFRVLLKPSPEGRLNQAYGNGGVAAEDVGGIRGLLGVQVINHQAQPLAQLLEALLAALLQLQQACVQS